jgi:uncharacterized membrane protein
MITIKTLNRIIFILSLIGIVIAIYVLQSFVRQSSIVCLTNGCEQVRKSSAAYPFGIPVPTFGLIGYSFIAILTFLRTSSSRKELLWAILAIATFGICFIIWFTYTEIFFIKAICTWCAISGINMLVVFILSIKSYLLTRKNYEIHK